MAPKPTRQVRQPVYRQLPFASAPPGAVTRDSLGGTLQAERVPNNSPIERLAFALSKKGISHPG